MSSMPGAPVQLIHASIVKLGRAPKIGLDSTMTACEVPLNESAAPATPEAQAGDPMRVPVCPLPVASIVTFPEPSSKRHHAAIGGGPASTPIGLPAASAPASAKRMPPAPALPPTRPADPAGAPALPAIAPP